MAGVLLCAFFFFGVMTGFSEPGRRLALRAKCLVAAWTGRLMNGFAPLKDFARSFHQSVAPFEATLRLKLHPAVPDAARQPGSMHAQSGQDAIAIVKRSDGFYALCAGGDLRGPVSPGTQPDLPILSGPGAESARAPELMGDAAIMVRAEAQLSSLVSEMRLESDGTASLFLDRARMEIVLDLDQQALELRRAMEVLKQWQGREPVIAMLDMTTPGLAVVRLRAELPKPHKRAAAAAANPKPADYRAARRVRIAERAR